MTIKEHKSLDLTKNINYLCNTTEENEILLDKIEEKWMDLFERDFLVENKNIKCPVEYPKLCKFPYHDFPSHLYIPPGESRTHICPNCTNEITVRSSQPIW